MESSELIKFETEMYEESFEDFVKRAERKGLKIVYPKPNQLQIDIDTDDQYKTFQRMEVALYKYFGIKNKVETVSGNGLPGRHITLDLGYDIDDMERILLQSVMGSDPMRELLSYIRIKSGHEHPTVFLEK